MTVRPRSLLRLSGLLRTTFRMAWNADRRLLLLTGAMQLVAGGIALGQILLIKDVLSAILGARSGDALSRAVVPVVLLAAVIAFTAAWSSVQAQWQRLLAELVTRRTWDDILDVTSSVGLREYDSPDFHDHLQRVQTNAVTRPFLLTQALVSVIGSATATIGLGFAVVTLQPLLLPVLLSSAIPLYLGSRKGSNLEFAFAVRQTPKLKLRDYLARVQSSRDEAKELRAFGTAPALRSRYDEVNRSFIADLRRHIRQRSLVALVSSLLSAAVLALTILAIIWMVSQHYLSLASAGAAIVAVRLLAAQISSMFGGVQQIFESGLFIEDLIRFTALKPGDAADEGGTEEPPAGFQTMTVSDLSFTYAGSSKPAISGVNLELRAGEVVALVGENGSGKTTLAKLLAALYLPASGRISWDGVDIRSYRSAALRRSIGVMFQDFVRYQLPASTNIALGRPDADDLDPGVRAAAGRAGVAGTIDALPHGYDTVLSNAFANGHDLSGGQWQRVALARAFYRDAPFVILDEPSASLDPRAESELFDSLRRLLDGRTVLYISHRLSTVRDADRIYVMAEGRIIESGTHDELMRSEGRYSDLFTLQAATYLAQKV